MSALHANLLLGAANVLQVCDEGRLALVQCSFQLFKRTCNLCYCFILPFVELARNLAHQLNGGCQLREPERRK